MQKTKFNTIKGIAAPAQRALAAAGYTYAEELVNVQQKDLAALHGMGPKALRILAAFLQGKGLSFR